MVLRFSISRELILLFLIQISDHLLLQHDYRFNLNTSTNFVGSGISIISYESSNCSSVSVMTGVISSV